jgi:branched-chain amino acid transport system permease protein
VATVTAASGSFWLGLGAGVVATAVVGMVLELSVLQHFYKRDHLSQVLGTFALLLMANEGVRMIWGSQPISLNPPEALAGPVELMPGFFYSAYRLFIIAVGLGGALLLYLLVTRTRLGMQVRAGASNRDMALAMGVPVRRLFTGVFALGAALCALAGGLLGPLLAVQVGMGESILILAFVVIVIGGIGSIAPHRRGDLARLGMRAMSGGSIAAFMTATIAGMLSPAGEALQRFPPGDARP